MAPGGIIRSLGGVGFQLQDDLRADRCLRKYVDHEPLIIIVVFFGIVDGIDQVLDRVELRLVVAGVAAAEWRIIHSVGGRIIYFGEVAGGEGQGQQRWIVEVFEAELLDEGVSHGHGHLEGLGTAGQFRGGGNRTARTSPVYRDGGCSLTGDDGCAARHRPVHHGSGGNVAHPVGDAFG